MGSMAQILAKFASNGSIWVIRPSGFGGDPKPLKTNLERLCPCRAMAVPWRSEHHSMMAIALTRVMYESSDLSRSRGFLCKLKYLLETQ
jgi:hypothetical protein